MTDLHYQSLSETCRQLKSGALSATVLTEHMLDRITRCDPELSSYALVLADSALQDAERLDNERLAGKPLGLLHGVPIAVKDLLCMEGIPTASGTLVMADYKPNYTATVVNKLRDAGAVILGKTQLTEGAFGVHHPAIEPPKNPWHVDHWPGVSSSGSGVAVSAGMAFGALGTDTGGSIRFPSAACGLVGIKPTYGRVSRHGAFPLAESLDHIGPMTRAVEDAARMLSVIAGSDANDPTTLSESVPNYLGVTSDSLAGMVVGVDWNYVSTGVDDVVVDAVKTSCNWLQDLGAQVREVNLPSEYLQLTEEWGITCAAECAKAHAEYYPAQRASYGPVLAGLLDLGLAVPPEEYAELEKIRASFRRRMDDLLADVDMLIAPCMTCLPPTVAEMDQPSEVELGRALFITFTAPFDYSGHPTLTLPVGLSADRLPLSVQLIGRRMGEPALIDVGLALERARGAMPHPDV